MSINSSLPSNSSVNVGLLPCFSSGVSIFLGMAVNIVKVLVLFPACVLVLYTSYQRWRRWCSFMLASHSDIFTLHLVVMELIWVVACICFYWGITANVPKLVMVGSSVSSITFSGETLFHLLSCGERYLAVLHPVTYRALRSARGARIRNSCVTGVWLLCCGVLYLSAQSYPVLPMVSVFCILAIAFLANSFFSLSVLSALIRQGPGEGGMTKAEGNRSKKRAILMVLSILGTLWLWVGGMAFCVLMGGLLQVLSNTTTCLLMACLSWCNIPISLELPLLYLHRGGRGVVRCPLSNGWTQWKKRMFSEMWVSLIPRAKLS